MVRGYLLPGFESVFGFFNSALFVLLARLFVLFLIVLWLSLVYWTYRDAQRRGAMGFYWAVIVFLFNVFGWLIYLIVRPAEYLMDVKERELEIKEREILLNRSDLLCPSCNKPVEKDFLVCPYCLKKLRNTCLKCGRPVNMDWRMCPYCKTTLPKS
jgi:uncharacterized membrane protein YqjE/RNA polymerase subunit RPABC4/transcription elongation factor Spt4